MGLTNYQLPEYTMTAGETQNITIMLFRENNQQMSANGLTARLAITDYINRNSEPSVVKPCSIVTPDGSEISALSCKLLPQDTVSLMGKFLYQVTIVDFDGTTSVLKGIMNISNNIDRGAIS